VSARSNPRPKAGLPANRRMRHDRHFVDELAQRMGEGIGRMVRITTITSNQDQPRSNLGNLDDLQSSIHAHGVLEPLLVRPADGGDQFLGVFKPGAVRHPYRLKGARLVKTCGGLRGMDGFIPDNHPRREPRTLESDPERLPDHGRIAFSLELALDRAVPALERQRLARDRERSAGDVVRGDVETAGGAEIRGRLPITVSGTMPRGFGILVPPANPQSLAEAIMQLLTDPAQAHQIGKKARSYASQFTIQNTTRLHAKLYEELISI